MIKKILILLIIIGIIFYGYTSIYQPLSEESGLKIFNIEKGSSIKEIAQIH